MKLYGYFRSSAAYRVRIALNLKGIAYEQVAISLVEGDQKGDDYRSLNPQGLVPTLETPEGLLITQSLAICEYLDERYPQTPLLPDSAEGRAQVRALAQIVACDIHPVNNLRILKYLTGTLGVDEQAKVEWYRHWVSEGFAGLEGMLARSPDTGTFCHGDQPGLADICLVPQVFNAERFECDMSEYPLIRRIVAACNALPAFAEAQPSRQPDAF